MICKNCGTENSDDATFCNKCGTQLSNCEIVDNSDSISSETVTYDAVTAKIKITEKTEKLISRCLFYGIIAGAVGAIAFLIVVLVGAIAYGEVYLFDGYTITKVITIISIILMMIGLCSAIAKTILSLVFKIGTFPTAIIKKILLIVLAVVCLGFSIWGFVDCSNTNNDSDYSSSSGSSSSSGTVSVYLGLKLSVTSIKPSGSYSYVYCSVTNVSSLYGNATMYRYVKVKAVFKDKYGSIIDTDWTYAVDSAWLNSGETKTFYYMVRNTSVASATLSIMS